MVRRMGKSTVLVTLVAAVIVSTVPVTGVPTQQSEERFDRNLGAAGGQDEQTRTYPRVVRLYSNGSASVRVDTILVDLTNESHARWFEELRTDEGAGENLKVVTELNWELDRIGSIVDRNLTYETRLRTEDRGQFGFVYLIVFWDRFTKPTENGRAVEPHVLDETIIKPTEQEQPPVRVVWPSGYDLRVSGPTPDERTNGSARWSTASRLTDVRLLLRQRTPTAAPTPASTPTPAPSATETTAAVPEGADQPFALTRLPSRARGLLVGGAGVVLFALALGGFVWVRGPTLLGSTDRDSGGASIDAAGADGPASAAGRVPDSIQTRANLDLSYEDVDRGRRLSSGGTATVYSASVDLPSETLQIAVKEPHVGETVHTETVERLLGEAKTWDSLDDHDHIVDVLGYGTEPLPWIAMEYMDAGDLAERVGKVEFDQGIWIALAIVEGVYHAHNRGVVHLDLKPANILFTSTDGRWDVPKIADWGGSKHLVDPSEARSAVTPAYAAPEQFEGGEVDNITDVFQVGILLYELFTGVHPFEGPDRDYRRRILRGDPTPPSAVANVPRRLDEILLTALARDEEERYESLLYLRDDLRELAEEAGLR